MFEGAIKGIVHSRSGRSDSANSNSQSIHLYSHFPYSPDLLQTNFFTSTVKKKTELTRSNLHHNIVEAL